MNRLSTESEYSVSHPAKYSPASWGAGEPPHPEAEEDRRADVEAEGDAGLPVGRAVRVPGDPDDVEREDGDGDPDGDPPHPRIEVEGRRGGRKDRGGHPPKTTEGGRPPERTPAPWVVPATGMPVPALAPRWAEACAGERREDVRWPVP